MDKTISSRPGAAPHRPPKVFLLKLWPFLVLSAVSAAFSIPFLRSIPFPWAEMNLCLQGAVFSLMAALLYLAWLNRNLVRASILFLIAFSVAYTAETAGVRGDPVFGYQYHYHPSLLPVLPGGVPLCIPMMWFLLAYTPLVFLRGLSIKRNGYPAWDRLLMKAGLCALFITASDFVIEPLGVLSQAWTWHERGRYFGAPLLNFIGWFMVGMVVTVCYFLVEHFLVDEPPDHAHPSDLVFGRVSIALMSISFLFCTFHAKSVFPALLAGAVMVPCWIYWSVSARRSR